MIVDQAAIKADFDFRRYSNSGSVHRRISR
jgi:hypothetical protein